MSDNKQEFNPQESIKLIEEMMSKVKDDELWRRAKKRVAFKYSATMYLLINGLLIFIWLVTTGFDSYFWPIWPMLGWGIGLLVQYFDAYLNASLYSEEKEFHKLKGNAK